MEPTEAVRHAVEQVGVLTGREIEGVLGVRRDHEGWRVTIELVERHRVPDLPDVLASYDVSLDGRGHLREYRRTRRYHRSQAEDR
ncbi:MAG TPA: gas vesicle protein GvpO [Solirubrobacteraceae bacterium]